jgi:hypothetical protein
LQNYHALNLNFLRDRLNPTFYETIKLGFSRYYNRRHNRRGFFWGDRFKSVIVKNGQTLINCLAYIDLNPVRAGIVEKPEEYTCQAENKQKQHYHPTEPPWMDPDKISEVVGLSRNRASEIVGNTNFSKIDTLLTQEKKWGHHFAA